MLNQNMNKSVTGCCFQALQDIAEILANIILNERARFQLQRAEIADRAKFSRKVIIHETTGNVWLY